MQPQDLFGHGWWEIDKQSVATVNAFLTVGSCTGRKTHGQKGRCQWLPLPPRHFRR
jgi:hypothetical protein